MNSELDLDAYFERIRYKGRKEPTLEVLRQLIQAHVQSIPFENLDVLLGRKIALDPASLVQKLVYDKRGGYCFEQNGLFLLVLETLGFQVTPVSARVRWQKPREFTPPRTHLFLRLEINEESWLADVGVGSVTPSVPLRLVLDVEQGIPPEPRRIIYEESRYFRQIKIADVWKDICEFTLEEMPMTDRELANWFTCAHPDSHFRNRLIAARVTADGGRLTLLNDQFTQRDGRGQVQKHRIESPQDLLEILSTQFGLDFEISTRFGTERGQWPFANE